MCCKRNRPSSTKMMKTDFAKAANICCNTWPLELLFPWLGGAWPKVQLAQVGSLLNETFQVALPRSCMHATGHSELALAWRVFFGVPRLWSSCVASAVAMPWRNRKCTEGVASRAPPHPSLCASSPSWNPQSLPSDSVSNKGSFKPFRKARPILAENARKAPSYWTVAMQQRILFSFSLVAGMKAAASTWEDLGRSS